MLRFRDRLRSDEGDRELQARTKQLVTSQQGRHGEHDAHATSDMVRQILARAPD